MSAPTAPMMTNPTQTARDAAYVRSMSRSASPFYGAHEQRPRRQCAGCGRQFVAVSRLETVCSFACAPATEVDLGDA